MNDHINNLAPDKLCVFVSSTIKECMLERGEAKRAIESLNHAPLLFEYAGARSYPPRTLYYNMVQKAHIFVAIYKNEYGWVAPDMSISGIEDEFQMSSERGMPRLIYILDDDKDRSPNLKRLIDEVKLESGLTVAYFNSPEDLYEKLRKDIEAEVARTFHDKQQLEASLLADANTILEATLSDRVYIPRTEVMNEISSSLHDKALVQITGPDGIGKTVVLAALAKERDCIYVEASRLNRKEVASTLAAKLRKRSNLPQIQYLDANAACADLQKVWKSADNVEVVIDECKDLDFINMLIRSSEHEQAKKTLLYSSRSPLDIDGQHTIIIPPMTLDESVHLAQSWCGNDIGREEAEALYTNTQGNPMLIRFYSSSSFDLPKNDLYAFENISWDELNNESKEILTYIALSPSPLGADDLKLLLQASNVSQIFDTMSTLSFFLGEGASGYSMIHASVKNEIMTICKRSPHRVAYYSKRLSEHFVKHGDFVSAYYVLDDISDSSAFKIANRMESW